MAAPHGRAGSSGTPLQIIRQESWARGGGINAWIWQRITAVALLVLLSGHMWVNHYADLALPADHYINFLGVQQRVSRIPWLIFNFLLLGASLFHGLNGVRNVIFDYGVSHRGKRAITTALVVLGVSFFAYGSIGLMNFFNLKDTRERGAAVGVRPSAEIVTVVKLK